MEIQASATHLDKQFSKAYFAKHFRGAYLGRSITRCTADYKTLYSDYDRYSTKEMIDAELKLIYPESLSEDLEKVRSLYEEKHTLDGVYGKTLTISGALRHRDKEIRYQDIPSIIETLKTEIAGAESVVQDHDIRCRTVHLALAKQAGKEWEKNSLGLISLLHYTEHNEANLRDLQGYLSNIVAVIMADDRVTSKELDRLLDASDEVHQALASVYEKAGQVELGGLICKQLDVKSWREGLGDFTLVRADNENINEWMNAIDGWIGSTINALSTVSTAALEQLLKVEAFHSKHHNNQTQIPSNVTVPTAPVVLGKYNTLVEGDERQLQTKLGVWDRFYTASGFFPAIIRFFVAAVIVGVVVFANYFTALSSWPT